MKKNVPVKEFMTKDPLTVHVAQKVSDVATLLQENNFHHVPIVSGTKLKGIISSTDIIKKSFEQFGANNKMNEVLLDNLFSLQEVMQQDVITLKTNETLRDALTLFSEGNFHSLPVVDPEGNLEGIVTSTDVFRYFLSTYY